MSEDLKKKKSDYLLELALEEQLEFDEETLKYEKMEKEAPVHTFSKEHNEKMQKIFKIADKIENRSRYRKRHRQIAAGIALFFCISAVSITQVEAFRLPFVRFFMEVKAKSTLFGVSEEMENGVTEKYKEYEPHYVPDGFAVLEAEEGDGNFSIKYFNDQKQQAYRFYFWYGMRNVEIDTEDGNYIDIEINGKQAHLIKQDDEVRILMNQDDKQFYLDGNIPHEEAIKIMKSIK